MVLSYINNEARHFHIYVANRVQEIREFTDILNWKFVPTAINPADLAYRGMNAKELQTSQLWWNNPEFLWENGSFAVKKLRKS